LPTMSAGGGDACADAVAASATKSTRSSRFMRGTVGRVSAAAVTPPG
jgi:hypothetical protein